MSAAVATMDAGLAGLFSPVLPSARRGTARVQLPKVQVPKAQVPQTGKQLPAVPAKPAVGHVSRDMNRRLGDEIPEPAPVFGDEPAEVEIPCAANGYATDPDVQLMLATQRGDLRSFETLVGKNQDRVYAICFRFVRHRESAEDLAQQVFLRVYRSAENYVPQARFVTWLYRICVNTALNHIRNLNRMKCRSSATAQGLDAENWSLPDESARQPWMDLEHSETESKVWEAVETLPERQKAAILLRSDGVSYEDIAETLSLSVVALKSLLARARARLKEMLDPVLA